MIDPGVPVDPAGAVFIGACGWPVSEEGNPAVYFRTEFDVSEAPTSATLRITTLGIVEPHLNGHRVGDEVLEPGWTVYSHRLMVRSHDVTALVRTGANALGAIVGEGWALGRIGFVSAARRRLWAERAALFAVLELRYADRVEHVTTDEGFRAGEGSVRANSIYDGEVVDARLEPEGWSEPGFDDSGWGNVEPVPWDLSTLVEPVAPPIRRIEELSPVDIWTSERNTTVVDFGQNISGWVRLRLKGDRGDTLTLRHAEVLVDGLPDYETLRTAKATDQFVLAGTGVEEFEPRFTFHGFRYAEIEGDLADLSPDDIRAVVVHSDMVRTGWFETSNQLVNRLHDNVVWSMRDNFVGVPTDCPQRDERLGWTGDLNAFSTTALYLYDVRGVLDSWLRDLALTQQEQGFVPYVIPNALVRSEQPTALWSDVAVSLPWALYQEYGDEDILRLSYDSMAMFTRSVEMLLDDRGLWSTGFQFGDWLDPDAPMDNPMGGKTEPHLVACAYFCKVTREMALTATILEREDDAASFGALADRVRAAFRDEYVSPNGRITNESATAYALAIQFDLFEPEQLDKAGQRLSQTVRAARFRISTGFAGTPHVAPALTRTGHTDDAYRLLLQTEMPSFLYPVTQGATTIWERWDSVRPDGTVNPSGMTSLNHYALGAVAHWLHTAVAGIEPTSPGYATVRIAPQPGGSLTYVRAVHDSVRGRVSAEWRIEDDTMTLEVAIPAETAAEVCLPLHPDGESHNVGEGEHRWSYPIDISRPPLTIDSSIEDLMADSQTGDAISEILGTHLPDLPLEIVLDPLSTVPLSELLSHIPGSSDGLREEMRHAIEGPPSR